MRTRTSPDNPIKFVPLLRIPAGSPFSCVFHDPEPTIVVVHRFERRTVECGGPECEFCAGMLVAQDRIFARIHAVPSVAPAILELPISHWERLIELARRGEGLCPWIFTFRRRGGRPNGPIYWSTQDRKRPWPVRAWPGGLLESLSGIWRENTEYARAALVLPKRQPDVHV